MDSVEAEELGRFRANLMRASGEQLAALCADSLNELIVIARRLEPGNIGVEVAAALAAEMERRASVPAQRSAMVGKA